VNDLGRGKRPTHNATYGLFHMSESYEELSKELAPFYREIEKGIRGCDKVSRTIELFETSDMKMSASVLGMTLRIFKLPSVIPCVFGVMLCIRSWTLPATTLMGVALLQTGIV